MRLRKPKQIAEHEAKGEIERVYHEIRQVLRVNGVNLNFRTWAGYGGFLPLMWDAIRPNAETRAFENAADEIRAEAVEKAAALGKLNAATRVTLGQSQSYQVRKALDLYHYVNPKLLLLTSAAYMALTSSHVLQEVERGDSLERLSRGFPSKMYPMEMVSDKPKDKRLAELFNDIKKTLSLVSINSDYRTLALWPDYLAAAWECLKPILRQDAYVRASNDLRESSRSQARNFPIPVRLSREAVAQQGEDAEAIIKITESFERLLPSLIINIALFQLDWADAETLRRPPFPAETRPIPTRQHKTEHGLAGVSIPTAGA
jgi:hypothetical protein